MTADPGNLAEKVDLTGVGIRGAGAFVLTHRVSSW
jgi:hypothetical protein